MSDIVFGNNLESNMLQRIRDLFDLMSSAWRIWREDGKAEDLEIEVFNQSFDAMHEENVIYLIPRDESDSRQNAVHFNDRRRRMH